MTLEILDVTKISKNYRINLGLKAREFLEVDTGDSIVIVKEDDEIKIRRA